MNIPKDRIVLLYGIPTDHPHLQQEITQPVWVTAYWDQCDEAFCVVTGDWMGPFVESITDWAELPTKMEDQNAREV